jgi:DMSO/TMAO reductase YedYZ molybdopterin-dependent catalytic subunit
VVRCKKQEFGQVSEDKILPPGQVEAKEFTRFGLTWFAFSFPTETQRIAIQIAGDIETPIEVSDQLHTLPRVDQVSDFHCVTSWSRLGERWSGVRFRDFHEKIIVPQARPKPDAIHVVLIGQDGYRNTLPLEDLLADDVLLADTHNGKPLTMEHGAPLRLVAPAHYGYKSVKHIESIEFWCNSRRQHYPSPSLLSHPRARVALQERSRYFPGWFYRAIYRPVIGFNAWLFRLGTARYNSKSG